MVKRGRIMILVGRFAFVVIVLGLIVYLWSVGLDKADKLASSIGVVIALIALIGPHLLRARRDSNDAPTDDDRPVDDPPGPTADLVEHSGPAVATDGGRANTGLRDDTGGRVAEVRNSGKATAKGKDSEANTGVMRSKDPQ